METQIHNIEKEAYTSILRAFKAQSDAITWEKESLITELRKELRVSDEEHSELLSGINSDDIIRSIRSHYVSLLSIQEFVYTIEQTVVCCTFDLCVTNYVIREWRKTSGGAHPGTVNNPQSVHDRIASPIVSASCKKPKMSQFTASLSMGAPSPVLHPPMQPTSSMLRNGFPSGSKIKKPKPVLLAEARSFNQGSSLGAIATNGPSKAAPYDPLIGKKVWTRWPDDNHFYEAVINDYNPSKGRHALVYDMNSADETWEWVNLKEIPPEDIRWEGEDPDPRVPHKCGWPGSGRGMKKSMCSGGAVTDAGRGRAITKAQPKKDFTLSQNGSRKKPTGDIEILHTDTLIKKVERVFSISHPDPVEMEKAKKMLKEHEQALVDAIARLGDVSDAESDGELPFTRAINGSKYWLGETAR